MKKYTIERRIKQFRIVFFTVMVNPQTSSSFFSYCSLFSYNRVEIIFHRLCIEVYGRDNVIEFSHTIVSVQLFFTVAELWMMS